MVHVKPIETRLYVRLCVKCMTVVFFAKPCSYDLPRAETLHKVGLLGLGNGGEWALACVRECSALLGLALAISAGDGSLFSYRRVGSGGRLLPWRFLLYDRSAVNSSVEGRWSLLRSVIPSGESAISGVYGRRLFSPRRGTDSRARNGGGCAAIGAGFTVALRSCGNSSVERATAASAIGVERATATTLVWEGWCFISPRRLAVFRASDAMDASGQMRHSASHPLFQRHAPPLASSQWPALVALQRNAPLQQSQRERVAPQPLVTSQREGVAPLQQPLVPPQQLVSHQDVPPLISSRRDAPSMNLARGHSRSRSRPPAPIS
ncbi:hypothetical protein BHM03_00025058 [Ensete ventricosum]|nr:hypothetical protein BHM03_00025058 [Ensete ventricosum]